MERILLIDDDLNTLSDFIELLRLKHRLIVLEASSVKEAFDVFESDTFDCIILDVMMSVPDDCNWSENEKKRADRGLSTGLIVYEKIRLKNQNIPILIYSARPVEKPANDRFTGYLGKPKPSDTIVEYLKKLNDGNS